MKKINYKKLSIVLFVVFLLIQFIPTHRNENTEVLASDFIKLYNPPTAIANKLKASCYDCHSNNTTYPWYNKVQPVAWFLENHINEAKEELNFSEFGAYSKRKIKSKLKSMRNEIRDDKMPLWTYTLMHSDAKFSDKEQKEILNWIEEIRANL